MNNPMDIKAIPYTRESWWATIIALIPFAGIPLIASLFMLVSGYLNFSEGAQRVIKNLFANMIILWYFGAFIIGWIKKFPRWWYPYSIFLVLASLFFQNTATPDLWLFGLTSGTQVWGWRAWVPLGGSIVLALLLTRSFTPFKHMAQRLWVDPSHLAFAVFGLLPIFSIILYDEVDANYPVPFLIISLILYAISSIFYMRAQRPWLRLFLIYSSAMMGALLNSIALMIYWNGRLEPWMKAPMRWQDQIEGTIMLMIYLTIIILGPVLLIEIIRKIINAKPVNPTQIVT